MEIPILLMDERIFRLKILFFFVNHCLPSGASNYMTPISTVNIIKKLFFPSGKKWIFYNWSYWNISSLLFHSEGLNQGKDILDYCPIVFQTWWGLFLFSWLIFIFWTYYDKIVNKNQQIITLIIHNIMMRYQKVFHHFIAKRSYKL